MPQSCGTQCRNGSGRSASGGGRILTLAHWRRVERWVLGPIEQARDDAGGDGTVPSGTAIGDALADRLTPMDRIVAFEVCFSRIVARAQQWELCAAAFVVLDYLSDDTFSDFQAGLVGLGRDAFERVIAVPDALADLPIVQAIAAGRLDRLAISGEAIRSAAAIAYERRTEDADDFWEALDALPKDPWTDGAPAAPWNGGFGSPEDGEQIPIRLPRLYALFHP